MKVFVTSLLLFICLNAYPQNLHEQLEKINTIRQANRFIRSNANAALIQYISFRDTTDVAALLLGNAVGYIHVTNDTLYKIIETKAYPLYRASYIYLDGSKLSKNKIDLLRKQIIESYHSGITFEELVQKHTMDPNQKRGDLGWFREGVMAKTFKVSVRDRQRGEVFTVDIPESNWYYVVLKTHDNLHINEVTVLKVWNAR